ncbi:MAG: glycosyltransferase, partial [Methyloprofundus sp.]|nr:glycosyltransferase [Methyloprofundus sp.]
MKNKLAPIILFVYNRPWHTQQTVEALQNNLFADQSDLIIYSDAAKNDQACVQVQAVRDYIKTVDGFKSVKIIERDKNRGLAANIIDGVTEVVNQYGKIIVMEDDIVTSPAYLSFMNQALDFYQNENKVWHISGW